MEEDRGLLLKVGALDLTDAGSQLIHEIMETQPPWWARARRSWSGERTVTFLLVRTEARQSIPGSTMKMK